MTNTYIDTHIETQEIEVPGFLDDPKVLAYLEGTDVNIDHLVLEEDGKLWAYSKRTPEALCRSSLEDMVAVAFPSYFMVAEAASSTAWTTVPTFSEAPTTAPVLSVLPTTTPPVSWNHSKTIPALYPLETTAPALSDGTTTAPAPEDKLSVMLGLGPKAIRKPRKAIASYLSAMPPLPVTGAARGLLASRSGGSGRPPSVLVNGVPRMVPKPIIEGAQIKVALRNPLGVLVGCAVLSRTDYCTLTDTPSIRADTMLWTLNADGEVTTRARGAAVPFEVSKVNDLLIGVRSESRVAVERQTWT